MYYIITWQRHYVLLRAQVFGKLLAGYQRPNIPVVRWPQDSCTVGANKIEIAFLMSLKEFGLRTLFSMTLEYKSVWLIFPQIRVIILGKALTTYYLFVCASTSTLHFDITPSIFAIS